MHEPWTLSWIPKYWPYCNKLHILSCLALFNNKVFFIDYFHLKSYYQLLHRLLGPDKRVAVKCSSNCLEPRLGGHHTIHGHLRSKFKVPPQEESHCTLDCKVIHNECPSYEMFFDIYRTCLRYFLPPHWMMDKDAVSGLSTQELANFPLDDFFDHYEKGLRKVIFLDARICSIC